MSNYDNPQLRYSCFSEPSLVSHSHPRSLTISGPHEFELEGFHCNSNSRLF